MSRSREPDDPTSYLTPNQVVAYNLVRARLLRSWTQEQAAEALAPYLGTCWSVASFSAAERSVNGIRIRQFTADDLLALSRGFDLPIGYFLTPPASGPGPRIDTPDTMGEGADPRSMIDALLGTDDNIKFLEEDLATWNGQARLQRLVQLRAKAALRQEFGDVQAAREVLTRLRQVLDDIDTNESFLRSTPQNVGTPPSIEGTP